MERMERIDSFDDYRKRRERRRRRSFGFRQTHRAAQEAMKDWQTDAYRSQSARREADVV